MAEGNFGEGVSFLHPVQEVAALSAGGDEKLLAGINQAGVYDSIQFRQSGYGGIVGFGNAPEGVAGLYGVAVRRRFRRGILDKDG